MDLDLQTDPQTADDDPLEALKKLKAQQGQPSSTPDPLEQLKALRAKPSSGHVPYTPRPDVSETPIWDRASAGIAAGVRQGLEPFPLPGFVKNAITHSVAHPLETALNVGEGVPGGKLAETLLAQGASHIPGLSSTGPMSYTEALAGVDEATKDTPMISKLLSRVPGAMVTGAALPAVQGVKAIAGVGAGLGALDRVLSPTPESVSDRLKGTATSAAIGAVAAPVISKVLDLGNAFVRGATAKPLDVNLTGRAAQRSAESDPLYQKFRDLGTLPRTPALDELVGTPLAKPMKTMHGTQTVEGGLPIVRKAIEAVKGESPELAKLADTDASVLAAAYQRVGSRAFRAANGFELGTAREALKTAIDEASGGKFAPAVDAYKAASQGMSDVTRGQAALRYASSTRGTPPTKVQSLSPAAFKKWASTASPDEAANAAEGITGELKQVGPLAHFSATSHIPIPFPSKSLRKAPDLLDVLGKGVSPSVRNAILAQLIAAMTPR